MFSPFTDEAGYDIRLGSPETSLPSALYTERAYFRARAFIVHALTTPTHPFVDELRWLYLDQSADAPKLLGKALDEAKAIIEKSERKDEVAERDGLRRISLGAVVMLRRQVERLEKLRGLEFGDS